MMFWRAVEAWSVAATQAKVGSGMTGLPRCSRDDGMVLDSVSSRPARQPTARRSSGVGSTARLAG